MAYDPMARRRHASGRAATRSELDALTRHQSAHALDECARKWRQGDTGDTNLWMSLRAYLHASPGTRTLATASRLTGIGTATLAAILGGQERLC